MDVEVFTLFEIISTEGYRNASVATSYDIVVLLLNKLFSIGKLAFAITT